MQNTTDNYIWMSKENYKFYFDLSLIFFYLMVSSYFYINHAFIPDKLLFINSAGDLFNRFGGTIELFKIDNAFGYGELYWIIHFCFYYFSDPQWAARIIYFVLLILSNFLWFFIIYKKNKQFLHACVLFFLGLPMVWWQGKITGSESLAHFFLIFSIFLLMLLPLLLANILPLKSFNNRNLKINSFFYFHLVDLGNRI